jgi:hypothetical protein
VLRWLASVGLAAVIGLGVTGLASTNTADSTRSRQRKCYVALRVIRGAVAVFEAEHGFLPGWFRPVDGPPQPLPDLGRASGILGQLGSPTASSGLPSPQGAHAAILTPLPSNPFTGSPDLVVVPRGEDPVAFAFASAAGWAYLADDGADGRGPLPRGLVLPCGREGGPGSGAGVQDIGFEIEDFRPWR